MATTGKTKGPRFYIRYDALLCPQLGQRFRRDPTVSELAVSVTGRWIGYLSWASRNADQEPPFEEQT